METERMLLDAEWRQRRAQELVRMLRRERASLEILRNHQQQQQLADCDQQQQQQPGIAGPQLERALCRIGELERQLHILSLLNSVTEGPNPGQQLAQANGIGNQHEKCQSVGSAGSGGDRQSSKTFPPSALRTIGAPPPPGGLAGAVAASKVEPIRSWVETGGMHYVQAEMLPIGDEEEEEDGDNNSEMDADEMEAAGPFANLQDLKTRPAHLAVFFVHLLNNANPSSLLFYLITDAYPASNVKEIRRFAYELFSTFLIPGAPLQLPGIAQRDIQAIDKVLRATANSASGSGQPQQDVEQLRRLFIPARSRAVGQINEQLAQFRRKRHFEANIAGIELDSLARADHAAELRLAERLFFRTLTQLVQLASPNGPPDWENCERRTLALVISVATLVKVVMGLRTSHSAWEKLLDKCPTFLWPTHKSGAGSVFKMRSPLGGGSSAKQKVQVKDHQFVLQPVFLTVHCYQCRDAVWGVNPQAYFCQNCDVVVHKNCTAHLADHCWPQQQQKSKSGPGGVSASSNPAGRLKFGAGSTTSLLSAAPSQQGRPLATGGQHQQQQHRPTAAHLPHRDSTVSSAYPHSVLGTECSSVAPFSHLAAVQQQQQRRLPSHKSSISLTPPLHRSQHSVSASAVAMAGSSKAGSSSIDRHGNDLVPPTLIDADGTGPGHPSASQQQRCQRTHMESLDSCSSPPSSTAMLPPPVFSSRFERILPPDIPPNGPPPPPPTAKEEQAKLASHAAAATNSARSAPSSEAPAALKSMDSGFGTEASPAGGTAQQQQHPNAGPTRSQSMKGEAANQLKRGGKGAGSLGAADAAEDGYERPIASQLAVPSVGSLKSSSSSAQDLPQVFHDFGTHQLVRAVEAIASSSTGTANEEEARRMLERVEKTAVADGDSDLEVETEVPSLESLISWEVLKLMKPKEKKRQEVINEFFHTERTHVRNLKILHKVFYRPMVVQKVAKPELVSLLFGNLDELLQVHSEMHQKMKLAMEIWRRNGSLEGGLYGDIGDLVEAMFDGPCGERLMHATATFCQNQQHALDTLRLRYTRSKEDQFSQFLAEAENNPLCRKLQLKDMIPVEMQRLVKYPLLLETVAKYTREGSDELQRLLHGVECAKRILSAVNTAKRNAENVKRMEELQRRLDWTGCEKSFFQKFDFRMHKLIYEGQLQWRQARGKTLDLHVVLLEHLLVFLTKLGPAESGQASQQKLQLKIHEAGCIPIMRLASVEVEEKPGDKRAFSLLYKCDLRLFELVAQTATERKTWFRLIENQVAVSRASPTPADVFLDGILPPSPAALPSGQSTPPGRARLQQQEEGVEMCHVLTHPSLVNANEIVVQQPTVMENAQPVLSVAERLRRSDKMIMAALAEKHRILAELLANDEPGNSEELERIAELMTGLSVAELKQRSSKELAMSAIVHGNRLLESINKGMSVGPSAAAQEQETAKPSVDQTERHLPSVPCYRLTAVAAPLMNHLKALLQVIQDHEAEVNGLRQQLQRRKETESGIKSTGSEGTARNCAGGGVHLMALKAIPHSNSAVETSKFPVD